MMLTLAKYKQLQGMPDKESPLDEMIKSCIQSAAAAIEEYCNRHFELKRRTHALDGGGRWLMLTAYPVGEIHSVTIGDEPLDGIVLDADRGMLYRAAGWPEGVRNIAVDYTGGYAEADMPINVVHAAAMLTKQMMGLLESGGQTAISERLGDYQVNYGRNMGGDGAATGSVTGLAYIAPAVAALLRPYVMHQI